MDFDRETIASAFVATGGAWLLGSVAFRRRQGEWNAAQLRGMAYAGVGFLTCAASARWLQHTGNRGIAVSMAGTMLATRGMYTLLRDRAAERAAALRGNVPETARDSVRVTSEPAESVSPTVATVAAIGETVRDTVARPDLRASADSRDRPTPPDGVH